MGKRIKQRESVQKSMGLLDSTPTTKVRETKRYTRRLKHKQDFTLMI